MEAELRRARLAEEQRLETERQEKLKQAREELKRKKKRLDEERKLMERKKEMEKKKKLIEEKKAEEEKKQRAICEEKLKRRLEPIIKTCEKIVLEDQEPSLQEIDKCIHDLRSVVHDCKINKFSNAQVIVAKEYLNVKTDPLGLFILREKRVKMDETIQKLINKKMLDDAKNEEISAMEAEHDSPWNIKSIVGFFGTAFSVPTTNSEGTSKRKKR